MILLTSLSYSGKETESKTFEKKILFFLLFVLFISNILLIYKNPDCPFHVDYVQYAKSIRAYYEKQIIEGNVNGKYLYIYLMGILLTPFYFFKLNLYDSLVFITGLFQLLIVYLFYKYTNSIIKTLLMATTLTFLTFLGHAETVMLGSVFLLLFFIYRDKPYSEFFIMIASFIRIDYAIYYLFSRNKTAVIPIAITFLQWLNYRYFLFSDFGVSDPLAAFLIFVMSFGFYAALILFIELKEKNLDWVKHIMIIAFLVFFLKFSSQKVFFFPVILAFMLYDLRQFKYRHWLVALLLILNVAGAFTVQYQRAGLCTPKAFYEFTQLHNGISLEIFQPYVEHYGGINQEPYSYNITQKCANTTDYFYAEDWRDSQLLFIPQKFCLT